MGVKVSFGCDKIVMMKNNVFKGDDYCNQGLFVLNVQNVRNEYASNFDYMVDYSLFLDSYIL